MSELAKLIEETVRQVLDEHWDEFDRDQVAEACRIRLTRIFNDNSQSAKILTSREKDRLLRLEKRVEFLQKNIETRDTAKTEELKQKFGDKYVDYAAAELSATKWVIEFVKEHSA